MTRMASLLLITLLILPVLSFADEMGDVHQHPACSYCGMKRDMFSHSRMLITYEDKSQFPACSIHCAALDFANQIDKKVVKIEVADFTTKKLLKAESAVWVIGGKVKGVMTARPKWAFKDKAAADSFIKENGGELADFDTAMKAAFEDMYKDTMMIRKKREKMRMGMKGDKKKMQH